LFSIQNHAKTPEVWTDDALLAMYLRFGVMALERYADRTDDEFLCSGLDLCRIANVEGVANARRKLGRLLAATPLEVEPEGGGYRASFPNLAKKQFRRREDGPDSRPSASATTTATKKKSSSRSEDPPRSTRPSDEAVEFASKFRASLKARTPDAKMPSDSAYARWIAEADRMFRIDERQPADAEELARWLFNDPGDDAAFWRGNVRAVPKFRTRFEELREHRARGERRNDGRSREGDGRAAARRIARRRGLEPGGDEGPVVDVRGDAGRLPPGEDSGR
jgi:hypothetical protein